MTNSGSVKIFPRGNPYQRPNKLNIIIYYQFFKSFFSLFFWNILSFPNDAWIILDRLERRQMS